MRSMCQAGSVLGADGEQEIEKSAFPTNSVGFGSKLVIGVRMPCICYGAVSGYEAFDEYLNSNEGKLTMLAIEGLADRIKRHKLPSECMPYQEIEFRQMFVKAFLHMLVGCDEKGYPKLE